MTKKIELAKPIIRGFRAKEETGAKILIFVGGRCSTKSTAAADYVLSKVQVGQRWCCAREYQNSIEDSCHALMLEEIERLKFAGFEANATSITHPTSGRVFYKGLARNPASIKSIVANGIWIEEAETLSARTISNLSASFRISAGRHQAALDAGEEASPPDIIMTMNRGLSTDPISIEYLSHAEQDLAKSGMYVDENVVVVECNYTDIPKKWFLASGLEQERVRDERLMKKAQYNHKWHGGYADTVENAIIEPEWVDACIDAHEKLKGLGDWFAGKSKLSFDPADVGQDPEAIGHKRGNVLAEVEQRDAKDIDEACIWACSYAKEHGVDDFVWDCDGMGIGLKGQISQSLSPKGIGIHQYKGSEGVYLPGHTFERMEDIEAEAASPKTNKDLFPRQRPQWYYNLAMRIYRTYLAVTKNRRFAIDDMISISSQCKHYKLLRAELCSIPRKYVSSGKFDLVPKTEMPHSPNLADCLAMLEKPAISIQRKFHAQPQRVASKW